MPHEIIFPAKGKFTLENYQDAPLGDDEIRGSTICSLISQGTEIGWANGDDFPIRPGYSAVFRVNEVGADVTGINPGDLRFCMGYHRSTQQYPAKYTLPVPEGMSAETAVIARLMGVSMTTLMTTRARPGDKVLICGAGPVGFLAAHLFSIAAYDVAVVEPDPMRRAQIEGSGISQSFAAMPHDNSAWSKKVALVLDCSGHEGAVLDGCNMAQQLGEVVLVGVPWRKLTDIPAHDVLSAVFFNMITLRSGWEWEVPILSRGFVWEELLEGYNNAPHNTFSGFVRALNWLSEGRVNLDGLVTIVRPHEPEKLYADIQNKRVEQPFIVVDWSSIENK